MVSNMVYRLFLCLFPKKKGAKQMVVSMDYMVSNMVIYMEGFYDFYGWFLWLI